jgi:hypothetical protein
MQLKMNNTSIPYYVMIMSMLMIMIFWIVKCFLIKDVVRLSITFIILQKQNEKFKLMKHDKLLLNKVFKIFFNQIINV